MRIASGVTDQYIYFVAVDATDLKTRETGLSSFTVRRSRNGAASAAMTTPTINETDSSNMPGVYELLLDEDMTIDSGDETQAMVFHITHAGMAPVTREIELFRPKITAGETLTVSSGNANAAVQSIANNAITAASIASDAITDAKVASDVTIASVTGAVGSVTGNVGGNVVGSVASVTAGVSLADGAITAAKIASDAITAAKVAADVSAEIADAVWEEAISDHSGTTGSTAEALNAAGSAGDPWTTQLPGAYGAGSAGKIVGDNLNATVSSRASQTSLDTVDDLLDTEIAAIKAKTDNLPADPADASDIAASFASIASTLSTIAGYVDTEVSAIKAKTDNLPADPADASDVAASFASIASTLSTIAGYLDTEVAAIKAKTDQLTFTSANQVDANVQSVNDVTLTGAGTSGNPWGPA